MHPFVHAFTPAIDPPWEAKSDFDTVPPARARSFSEHGQDPPRRPQGPGQRPAAARHPRRDRAARRAGPGLAPTATVAPVPGQDDAGLPASSSATTPPSPTSSPPSGPLADTLGFTVKNVTYRVEEEVDRLAATNGVMLGGAGDGRPAIDTDAKMAEAILTLLRHDQRRAWPCRASGPWRSGSARSWPTSPRAPRRSGSPSPTPRSRPVPVITSPEWSGSETGGRRYAPFTVNIERLKPFHTLTGRMHFYLDHDWMRDLGEALPIYRPPLDMHRLFGEPELGPDGAKQVTVRYLTPHSKWSIHSEYQDNLFMLSLSRGGPTVWMSPQDAGLDRGRTTTTGSSASTPTGSWSAGRSSATGCRRAWCSSTTRRSAPSTSRSPRRPGAAAASTTRVTRLLVKPTHLIGGYAQLSYTFNYLGPTGNQRDMVVRRCRKRSPGGDVLMRGHGPDGHGDEPRQVHRVPHLLGDLQAGLDQPRRHRVRLVQQRRDPARDRGIRAATRTRRRGRAAGR